MAYIGNLPATGQNNSFRLLDDITSYTLTFDGSSASVVNSSDKTIESANHRFVQGQRVVYTPGGTPVANLTGGTAYFIIKQGGSHFQLATSATNASNGVAISISAAGSATSHTLIASFDAVNTRFMASHSGGTKVNITRSAQLNISINGVIQEPQETASPTAGFGRDSGSVIVFSTAPNAGDAFWGSLVADNVPTFDISDNDVDNFTGDDSTTDFTLSKTPPDPRNILVTLDGVTQHPSDNTTTRAYTVTENILSFTSAPSTSVSIQVRHIGFAGATSGSAGVSAFYGRTGSVVLKNTDTINVANIVDEGYLAVGSTASFGGNVSIGGTLTYDDVTYVEAVGLSTFHEGINVIGISTFQNNLHLLDGDYLRIGGTYGSADGLNIYHASDHSYIDDAGTGNLYIRNGTKNSIFIRTGGEVILYNNDEAKFKTTGYGVTVVGDLQTSGITTIHAANNQQLFLNHPATNGQTSIAFQSSKSTKWILGSNKDSQADQDFFIFDNTNSKHRFNIKADGSIGIGSDNPRTGFRLDVNGDLSLGELSGTDNTFIDQQQNGDLHIINSGRAGDGATVSPTGGAGGIGINRYNTLAGGTTYFRDFTVYNGKSTKVLMVDGSTSRIGIGTDNPQTQLHLKSSDPALRIQRTGQDAYGDITADTAGKITFKSDPGGSASGDGFSFTIDNSEKLNIDSDGITVTGEVAASQDYPNIRPVFDFNFAATKKLRPEMTFAREGEASFHDGVGSVKFVSDNQPRFEHDILTGECKGLMFEGAGTNYSIYSRRFDVTATGSWVKLNSASITADTHTAPDGTSSGVHMADTLTGADGTAFDGNVLRQYVDAGANVKHTFSIYIKFITSTQATIYIRDGATGSTSSANAVNTKTWQRVVVTSSAALTNGTTHAFYIGNTNGTIAIWGSQIERSDYVTSYIKQTGATNGTRNTDKGVHLDGEDVTDVFNDGRGTLIAEAILTQSKSNNPIVGFYENFTDDNRVELRGDSSATGGARLEAVVNDSSVVSMTSGLGHSGINNVSKYAYAFELNNYAGCVNGGTVATDTNGAFPSGMDSMMIGEAVYNVDASVIVKRIMYYADRLPNSQLVTLTS